MSRYSRAQSDNVSFIIVVLVGAAAWAHRAELVHIAYVAFGVMGCLLFLKLSWKLLGHRRFAQFKNIDAMDGLEFEHYVAELLRRNGFHNVSLTEKYDFGVDIITEKDGIRWGIQAKRYSGVVKADAVRQVVCGLRLYSCDRAIVITNSTYSSVAQILAAGNDCVLIDRVGLKQLKNNRGAIL
ncbi:restriction endonuclease [Microbacteriaceae bacterium]|nr:restriction endonuclease [Candidatus Saccharibacteria bacterium]